MIKRGGDDKGRKGKCDCMIETQKGRGVVGCTRSE